MSFWAGNRQPDLATLVEPHSKPFELLQTYTFVHFVCCLASNLFQPRLWGIPNGFFVPLKGTSGMSFVGRSKRK